MPRTRPRDIAAKCIKLYQKIVSPFMPPICRFEPSCSEYFRRALLQKGIFKGSLAGIWRILRCNPFCRGGHDPVR